MKKIMFIAIVTVLALVAGTNMVFAGGTGTIRVDPYLPMGVSSPAEFEVWVKPSSDPTSDPHIFLVMTESCFDDLTGDVTVDWTGDSSPDLTIPAGDWTMETEHGKKVPPGTTEGAGYTVASLKDHLETSEPIYWAFKPFLDGNPLTTNHAEFNVTLPSDSPRMLVYVLGKTDGSNLFNCRVPPTIPGFVVPEPVIIATVGISLATFAVFAAFKRRRQ